MREPIRPANPRGQLKECCPQTAREVPAKLSVVMLAGFQLNDDPVPRLRPAEWCKRSRDPLCCSDYAVRCTVKSSTSVSVAAAIVVGAGGVSWAMEPSAR